MIIKCNNRPIYAGLKSGLSCRRVRAVSGNAVLMLLPIVLFMLIFGFALIKRSTSEHTQSFIVHRQNVVTYFAEGALNIAMQYVSENLEKKYKSDLIENKVKLVKLYETVPDIKKNVDFLLSSMPGAELTKLTMDFSDAAKFDKLQRDPHEKMGLLIFSCDVKYIDISTTLKIVRDIKIVNIAPPAEEFTLYTNVAQENEKVINTGPQVFCINKDEETGAHGSIRIAGGEKGNIYYIGEKYVWPDQGICPVPEPTRSAVYAQYGIYNPSQLLNAVSDLPKPIVNAFKSSLEIELQNLGVLDKDKKRNFYCIINVGSPLPDLPKEVFGGAVYDGPGAGKAKLPYGKGGLFGYPTLSNIKNKKLYLPKKLYGKGLKKRYAKYNLVENHIQIPVSFNPPKFVDLYVYYYGPKEAQEITEPYSSADRLYSAIDSDSEGRIGFDGCAALKGEDYKKRAFYATEEINMTSMQPFANGGSFLVNGVLYAKKIELGTSKQAFAYNGRFIMASDGEMTINHNIIINEKLSKKIPSNLSLVLFPKGALENNLAVTPIKYRARPIVVEGDKMLVLKLDANIFSYNGMEFVKDGSSGSINSGLTKLYIQGNFAVNRFIKKDFSPQMMITYKKRVSDKNYGQYVVNMSPIYSAWYEDKKGGK